MSGSYCSLNIQIEVLLVFCTAVQILKEYLDQGWLFQS